MSITSISIMRAVCSVAAVVAGALPVIAGDGYGETKIAKPEPRFYVGVFGGVDFADEQRLNGANAAGQVREIDIDYENGNVFGASLGLFGKSYSWGRVRGDVELAYREFDVENLALNGVERVVRDGSETSLTTGLVNAYYDTPLFYDRIRFSVGAGVGIANINHGVNYLVANAAAIGSTPGNLQIALPSSETAFAWQVSGGAELKLTDSISLVGDVRYLQINDVQVERYIGNSIINGVATTNGTLDSILNTDFGTVSVTGGLRVSF